MGSHFHPFDMTVKECCDTPEQVALDQLSPPTRSDDVSVQETPPGRHNVSRVSRAVMAPLRFNLVLENKGNVARDHLASERTYLTYVQTSLACAGAGVTLVQLFTLSTESTVYLSKLARPLGASIVLFGLVILVFGFVRYFSTQAALVRGYYPVAQGSMTMLACALVLLVGVVFGIIVAGRQS